jgi:hypothetical protein
MPLYLLARMSSSSKANEGLKDSESKKGHLGKCPPIPYVPPMDLLQAKDNTEILKVKLPNASVFYMIIFAKGSPEEYLQHVIAILCLINQKGLDALIVVHNKEMKSAAAALGALKQKSIGPVYLGSSKDLEACKNEKEALKLEKALTQEMLVNAIKAYNEDVAATYKLLHNLLAKPQTQWDRIIQKMHEHDLWAGENGEKHNGKHPKSYITFLDCLELHKLTVFIADTAKGQCYYVQQGIQKPQWATVRQFISRVEVLNG